MERAIHKKITEEDKFARRYYCQHARLNQLRSDKKRQHRKLRRIIPQVIFEGFKSEVDSDE